MTKIYKKLTPEQKIRGVIFSSTLSTHKTEQDGDKTHEVFNNEGDQENREKIISRLLDDSFFNGSPWKYNIIRQ